MDEEIQLLYKSKHVENDCLGGSSVLGVGVKVQSRIVLERVKRSADTSKDAQS